MSDHKKPSEVVLSIVEAGEVIHELSPVEELVSKWQANTYRGSQILDIEPQRWNVPGWLPSDSVVAVYAAPGIGKVSTPSHLLSSALVVVNGWEQNLSRYRCCMLPPKGSPL